MTTLYGYEFVVHYPYSVSRPRPWRERLLTWPWRPLQKEYVKWLDGPVKPDECLLIDGVMHLGYRAYERLLILNATNYNPNDF